MIPPRHLRQWIQDIARRFKPEKVILFGSYAHGSPDAESDLDLLVIMPHRGPATRTAALIRLALPTDIAADVIVRSPQEINRRVAMNDFFIQDILATGQVLYVARHP